MRTAPIAQRLAPRRPAPEEGPRFESRCLCAARDPVFKGVSFNTTIAANRGQVDSDDGPPIGEVATELWAEVASEIAAWVLKCN